MWSGMGYHMGWMWIWWIGGLVVLVLLVWAIARGTAGPAATCTGDSPEAILKRRYAHGDIDREEYERRLGDLRK